MITLQKAGKTNLDNFKRRALNIRFFASIERTGLSFPDNQNELSLYTINNEIISIKYPGKESINSFSKPWDFRPILVKNNLQMKDLSFGDIWEILNKFFKTYQNNIERKKVIVLLSRIFYKISFLKSHDEVIINEKTFFKFNKELLTNDEKTLLDKDIESLDINNNPLTIKLESFVITNDLLCSNEDTKYFYRNYFDREGSLKNGDKVPNDILTLDLDDSQDRRKLNWEPSVGRINTFLTHVNVLKSIHDEVEMFHLLALAVTLRGIFQIKNDENLMIFLNQYNQGI